MMAPQAPAMPVQLAAMASPAGQSAPSGPEDAPEMAGPPAPSAPAVQGVARAALPPRPRPEKLALAAPDQTRCTADGKHCIHLESYVHDVCALIQTAARTSNIDAGFLARLLWRESLFDAGAVSPAGAEGIAQFIPSTAALRGLADPFNPAAAIFASAAYLSDLTQRFGNPGLAAVAYNGGEARAAQFIDDPATLLPAETLSYVATITGHTAQAWRDGVPNDVDFRLDGDTPFQAACNSQAADQGIAQFRPPLPPWGAIVASGRTPAAAHHFADAVRSRSAGILGDANLQIIRARLPGFGRALQYTVQVPAQTHAQALETCRRLQDAEAYCRVKRN